METFTVAIVDPPLSTTTGDEQAAETVARLAAPEFFAAEWPSELPGTIA